MIPASPIHKMLTRIEKEVNETKEILPFYLNPSYFVGGRQLLFVRSRLFLTIHSKARYVNYLNFWFF